MVERFRRLEINGGVVETGATLRLRLPPVEEGYSDAQIDDYSGRRRSNYPWLPGTSLQLQARFSTPLDELLGTAGFGFWNAPMSEPGQMMPALPQSTWFFYASPPNDLPLPVTGRGGGWFVSTLDASTREAVMMAPLAPAIILLNNFDRFRSVIWPKIRRWLGISFLQIDSDMTAWHHYRLDWALDGCRFFIDGEPILQTNHSPSGRLGFVSWIDNRWMIARPSGRFQWGFLPIEREQWLEIDQLKIKPIESLRL